ncbi:L-seryl-tRNA(Sec) selenium transferase [Desulfitobacterium sp. AusDCA]|uniref:L-seryl-tRNA(Sec) selenium transferase n=1 Tax=Desulfitobacterium sp. AusDCA TaxID=3240383 RepID=UPI003DA70CEF
MDQRKPLLRALPAVHEVQSRLEVMEEFTEFLTNHGDKLYLTKLIREVLQKARENILSGRVEAEESQIWNWIMKMMQKELRKQKTSLCRVINATGVVLHTNCGRAILAPEVVDFVAEQAGRYSNLELNLENGERGSRYVHVEKLLCDLTGAEAAMVVNNNAAAVLLVINTFALGKEVIVSRGELVEIGGSFRIPEVLKAGGARLVEVGSTNRTWIKDYEEAVHSETGLLFKAHTSNYRIEGFTHSISSQELVQLGEKYQVPVVEDLGSGSFIDGTAMGFQPEPTVSQAVQAGLTLITFSGDKLLGGPQAGIIIGKREFIDKLKKNQLTRALRIDKLTLAALEGTLRLYERQEADKIPIWRMLTKPEDEIRAEAELLKSEIEELNRFQVEVFADFSQVGGGAWPTEKLSTWVCAIRPLQGNILELDNFLRTTGIPVLTRIKKDWILFDPRTLLEGDIGQITALLDQWNT